MLLKKWENSKTIPIATSSLTHRTQLPEEGSIHILKLTIMNFLN